VKTIHGHTQRPVGGIQHRLSLPARLYPVGHALY
jgi:hypothetical protein